jgi:hypothetical protein
MKGWEGMMKGWEGMMNGVMKGQTDEGHRTAKGQEGMMNG